MKWAALAVVLGAACSHAGEAPDSVSGWDVSVRAGATHTQDTLAGFPHQDRFPYEFQYSTGSAFSLAARYRFTARLRGELEITTRRHELSESSPAGAAESGRLDFTACMLNAYYDFDVAGPWRPYVGIGIGDADVRLRDYIVDGDLLVNDDARAAALQLIGGFEYDLGEHLGEQWRAAFDYRYLQTRDGLFVSDDGDVISADQRNHTFFLGLSRRF